MRGLGVAASALVGLSALGVVVTLVWLWRFKGVYEDYLAGRATDVELLSQVEPAVTLSAVGGVVFIAAAVVTAVWLWRVRVNAEALNPGAAHRWGRGAAVWGWLPVVNFWVPRRVVLDVVGSGASGVPVSTVNWWWGTWLSALVLERFTRLTSDPESRYFDLSQAVLWAAVCAVLMVAAAVFFVRIVQRVTAWQSDLPTYQPGQEAMPPFA
ncbi:MULTISPECIES: DUF4328 domain-containing protein [unclassified Saccharothrix]|uniref:DUF4328 domain-containing protein n=1 Tax=unclassified Saccharothrix TaxID=2593673 RepID=UPI00307E88DE